MVQLTSTEREIVQGREGPARAMAMRIVADTARMLGAARLVPIASSHIDGCLYHGDSGTLFAERLVEGGGTMAVPTTLNVGALDLLHGGRAKLEPARAAMARRMMEAYLRLGCRPTWTCAPYQAGHRPALGQHVAWGESNAVAFCNSVLGAWLGETAGGRVAAFTGLPRRIDEDRLKAMGAAAASTGAVGLFHLVGTTPEDPQLVIGHETFRLTGAMLQSARDRLSTTRVTPGTRVDVVAVGSPHFSFGEFRRLFALLAGRKLVIPFYVCTGRHTLEALDHTGLSAMLRSSGLTIVADTCIVVTPILPTNGGLLLTNSGKFAHYTRPNTGYDVLYGSLADCVETAVSGRLRREEALWR